MSGGEEEEPTYVTKAELTVITAEFNKQLNDNIVLLREAIMEEVRQQRSHASSIQGGALGE